LIGTSIVIMLHARVKPAYTWQLYEGFSAY
jgi:hypothetical protein